MSNLKAPEEHSRIWELDAVRGLMIIAMLIAHLWYMEWRFCVNGYYHIDSYQFVNKFDPLHFWFDWGDNGIIYMAFLSDNFRAVWSELIVSAFFTISGICITFSRNEMKAIGKLLATGLFLTAYTYALYRVTKIGIVYMRFSVIMCMAVCHLLYELLLKNLKPWVVGTVAVITIFVGYYLLWIHPLTSSSSLLHPLGIRQINDSGEYFPIFPYLGWLLIGVLIGRKWYSEKKTLYHIEWLRKGTRSLQIIGKYSGVIYVLHVVIYMTAFPVMGYILHIL